MGIIQNAINQTLQVGAVATGAAKEFQKQELQFAAKRGKSAETLGATVLKHATEKASKAGLTKDLEDLAYESQVLENLSTAGDVERSLALSKASSGGLIEGSKQLKKLDESRVESRDILKLIMNKYNPGSEFDTRYKQAMIQAAEKQSSQLNQEEEFKNYVSNLESNFGKVGDLPPHVQALVAQQLKEQGGKKDGE